MPTLIQKSLKLCFVFYALLAIFACDKANDSSATMPYAPTAAAGNCTVQGVVKFSAAPPPTTILKKDCCPGAQPILDDTTVVNPDGTLKNVVVFIKNGPNVPSIASASVPEIDQKNCQYVPHVSALRVGEPIDIASHDACPHNVHVIAEANQSQNFALMNVGESKRIAFSQAEVLELRCDVHPWMLCYIYVFNHPYFAVTGSAGKFKIDRLPPGRYTLVAWHEKYGTLEQSINIADGQSLSAPFEFKPAR